jgi:predicted transcriptional regulator
MSDGMTVATDIPMSLADDLRNDQKAKMKAAVLDDIRKNPGTWKEDIAKRIGIHRQTVTTYVNELVAERSVTKERRGQMDVLQAVGPHVKS